MTEQNLHTLEKNLNEMILEGKILEGFEKFYADDVVMQENTEKPRKGKEANRKYEEQFVGRIDTVHGVELLGDAVGDGVTYSEWLFDVTLEGQGRQRMVQVAARRWKNGKVVNERFYHA